MIHRPSVALRATTLIAVAMLLGGCRGTPDFQQTRAQRDECARELPVTGEWSEPSNALRCRLRAAAIDVKEMDYLNTGLELENTSDSAVSFTANVDEFLPYHLDNHVLYPRIEHAQLTICQIHLDPTQHVILPACVRLEPDGDKAISGRLSASLPTKKFSLATPPIQLQVTPAEWSPATSDLRILLHSLSNPQVVQGQDVDLSVSVQSLATNRLLMRPWGQQSIERTGDQITVRFTHPDDLVGLDCSPGYIDTRGIRIQIAEPGTYRLRVELDASKPWRSPKGETWSGKVTSNEILLTVKPAPGPGPR